MRAHGMAACDPEGRRCDSSRPIGSHTVAEPTGDHFVAIRPFPMLLAQILPST